MWDVLGSEDHPAPRPICHERDDSSPIQEEREAPAREAAAAGRHRVRRGGIMLERTLGIQFSAQNEITRMRMDSIRRVQGWDPGSSS